jgi:3-carboxy-cis,cis-muconate cycloisomerase
VTLFAPLFVPDELREATSDRAWLEAMLEAERALANAGGLAGVIPPEAAGKISDCCDAGRYSIDELAAQGRAVGNPAEPLVRALREAVGAPFADYVHGGATSQDIVDTAAMIVARRALGLILDDVDRVAAECSRHARIHAATPMTGRTLLQAAVPITFGLKAAGWLVAVVEARRGLLRVRTEGLAAQLGGAAGTLALLGERAPEVVELYAAQLELPVPVLPWHANRTRIAELGGALAVTAGVLAKIGMDIGLLAASEVAEVREAAAGGSSTMPQKQNPVGSMLAVACGRSVAAHASVLTASLVAEHERAFGGWQAEWPALTAALALTGGAASSIADVLGGLEVDAERMLANLDARDGSVFAERVVDALSGQVGRAEALDLLAEHGTGDDLLADARVGLSRDELDALLDPAAYLGSAGLFVERALAFYEEDSS